MKRRALLATLGTFAAAGCLGRGGGDPATTTTTRRTTQHTTQTTPSTTQTTASATPPEVGDLGVPVGDVDSPFEVDGSVERVVWYPDQAADPLSLTPDSVDLSLPTDGTTFTLSNDTDYDFSANFYDWGLHKQVDGQWFYLAPQEIPEPLHVLPAGESHEWAFTVANTREPSSGASGESSATVAGLGGGTYAFEISGWFDTGDHNHRIGVGTRFHVDGDQLELEADDDVSTTRDGDTVTATIDAEDGSPTGAFVVENVGEEGVPAEKPIRTRLAEQVVRHQPGQDRRWLRDALALFADGVATVRIESSSADDLAYVDREGRTYVEFRGDVYEIEVVAFE